MIYLFYKLRMEDIYPVKFILEGFENMMIVSTVDELLPKIQITIAPDFLEDCLRIMADLMKDFLLIPIADPDHVSQGNF